MDPNANLRRQLELVAQIVAMGDVLFEADDGARGMAGAELADHVEALDEWLRRGGALPEAWQGGRTGYET